MNFQLYKPFFRFFSALYLFFFFQLCLLNILLFPVIFTLLFVTFVSVILLIIAQVTANATVERQYLETVFQIFQILHTSPYSFNHWGYWLLYIIKILFNNLILKKNY